MQVEYSVTESSGKGQGIFTLVQVPRYGLVWSFDAANVRIHNDRSARALFASHYRTGMEALSSLIMHAYFTHDGLFIDIREDDGRFFNHSSTPNVALGSVLTAQGIPGDFHPNSTYALRDLQPGEELVDDYNTYGQAPEEEEQKEEQKE